MNIVLPRFLKTAYRKEPVSAFILVMGVVDTLIGGFNERWTLLSFGLVLLVFSVAVRWLQAQKVNQPVSQQPPRRYLPPSAGEQPLPVLKKTSYRNTGVRSSQ
jgi:hypothetical protein